MRNRFHSRVLIVALVCSVPGVAGPRHAVAQAASDPAGTTWVRTASGLSYQIVKQGHGPMSVPGNRVTIHETLMLLPDGKLIFSSRTNNQPVTFTLGANQVIRGVEEGVTGMRVGERRHLLVPPSLDGRTFDPAFIPPDAVRHYDIELIAIQRGTWGRERGTGRSDLGWE